MFSTGKGNINEELITDGFGVMRTIITRKTLYLDPSGIKFLVGVISDITEIKRSEQLVQQTTAVNEQPATFIHPWDGPPAKEPVYPPGTYRGMF